VHVETSGAINSLHRRLALKMQVRAMPLFTTDDHPNTLAAADTDGNHLWIMLHNLGDVGGATH